MHYTEVKVDGKVDRIPDIWILGYSQSLERTHPEMSPRQRFVAAVQAYRDAETKACETRNS